VTNGICPLVITRAWLATDPCGNTSTCSQTVTVAPALPPNSPAVISGPIYNPANGHYYYLLAENTWTASEVEAVAMGGHLATVRNQAENNWIYTQFSQFGGVSRGLWIGLNDAAQEGDFVWASGEPVSYFNWGSNEPVNQNELDDYVHLFWPGDPRVPQWNDQFDVIVMGSQSAGVSINGVVEVSNFPPLLACAPNKTVACGTSWDFDAPNASDSCSGANVTVTVVNTVTNSLNPLVITRTWQAVNACNNTNTCSQVVTVLSGVPPSIACPADMIVAATGSGASVTFTAPVVTGGVLVDVSPPSGSTFPIGTTQVTCTATNVCGVSTCSFRVTVANPCAAASVSLDTGFNHVTNGLLAIGAADSFWTVLSDADVGTTEPRPATVIGKHPAWAQPMTNSQWISSYANAANDRNGTYEFQTRFCLSAGWSNAVLQLALRADDRATVLLNQEQIGTTATSGSFNSTLPTTIVVNDQTKFVTGSNLLVVRVENVYAVAMGLNLTGSVSADGLSVNQPQCCQPGSSITGRKFNDQNANGIQDASEPGLPGWTIQLASGTNLWTTLTDTNGYYYFLGLSPGTYSVTEQQVAGWIQSAPTTGSHNLTLQQAQAVNGLDFGNRRLPCLQVLCPPEKTVECGKDWKFDAPVATSCCGTGILIIPSSVSTNGTCPKVVTQRWMIIDECGTTNVCVQSVTIVDRTPPTMLCPTNGVVVALVDQCRLEIPTIRPPAHDNCTPTDRLVYTQDPPPGTLVDGPCRLVKVSVRDACGNIARCEVEVCGKDKTPPVIVAPKTVSSRDCSVPNLKGLVSASDNCTASNLLVVVQSPVPGAPIASGANTVWVTVTDQAGNSATVQVPITSPSQQSFLHLLFNTGVDAAKALLPVNGVDPHYTLGPVPTGTPTGPGAYNPPNGIVVGGPWGLPPVWPFTASRWIAPAIASNLPAGIYIYTNRFVLPPGADPLTASLSGRWAADDGGGLFFNGLATGHRKSTIATASPSGFTQWTQFTINNGFVGFPAINTLYFVVTNTAAGKPNYTGLRVEFTDAIIHCATCAPPVIVSGGPKQWYPLNGTASFHVNVSGTPPWTVQWYRNNQPVSNGGHYSGANTTTLTVSPIGFGDSGAYYAVISNACGQVTSPVRKLAIKKPWWSSGWGEWTFSHPGRPLAADFGPDLIFEGPHQLSPASGTTIDFDLPSVAGDIARVLHIPNWPAEANLMIPQELVTAGAPGNYTMTIDTYIPSQPADRVTLFSHRDGTQSLSVFVDTLSGSLKAEGTMAEIPFALNSSNHLRRSSWNRIAWVVESAQESPGMAGGSGLSLYLNGKPAGQLSLRPESAVGTVPFGGGSMILGSSENTGGESYIASIRFNATAVPAELLATFGSPEETAIISDEPSTRTRPVLVATASREGLILSWTGSFILQETAELSFGQWRDSSVSFEQCCAESGIVTTVTVPANSETKVRFYRLIEP